MASDITMKDLLQATIDEGASDLHVRALMPPELRVHGELVAIADECFTEQETYELCQEIMTPGQIEEVERNGGCDFALAHDDGTRFRVSVFKERGRWGCVLRMIPSTLLTLDQIGLPPSIRELLFKPRGLILVTGPTGSGKSTTLASMIDVINQQRGVHVVTIEDPIEFYHTSKKSLVTQREVGSDVPSFAEAIRRALRQDPDVILVGEMRDLETIGAAITAAETGHLVFGTLHTTGAAETIDRIVDAFPTDQQEQVRTQLSVSMQAVISQILLPRLGPDGQVHGRIAAFEIMLATSSIRSRIRDNKTFQIRSDIQTGAKYGMVTLDACLMDHYRNGLISYDELITKSQDPDTVVAKLKEEMGRR
ncbi:MAG: type IV pilus twitching motility protein PilT [Kiritimatiellae bacterium]|nr:type IV pilus twitching motility protein PilT [Kiritimatiellia bacterium]